MFKETSSLESGAFKINESIVKVFLYPISAKNKGNTKKFVNSYLLAYCKYNTINCYL